MRWLRSIIQSENYDTADFWVSEVQASYLADARVFYRPFQITKGNSKLPKEKLWHCRTTDHVETSADTIRWVPQTRYVHASKVQGPGFIYGRPNHIRLWRGKKREIQVVLQGNHQQNHPQSVHVCLVLRSLKAFWKCLTISSLETATWEETFKSKMKEQNTLKRQALPWKCYSISMLELKVALSCEWSVRSVKKPGELKAYNLFTLCSACRYRSHTLT